MAAYAQTADIAAEFKKVTFNGVSTATTNLTDTAVQGFCDQTSALIDGKIGKIYLTPATGTTTLLILKAITIGIVAARIRKILEVKTGNPEPDQGPKDDSIPFWKMVEQIVKRELLLPDAALVGSAGGVGSYTQANSVQPTFRRGTTSRGVRQW